MFSLWRLQSLSAAPRSSKVGLTFTGAFSRNHLANRFPRPSSLKNKLVGNQSLMRPLYTTPPRRIAHQEFMEQHRMLKEERPYRYYDEEEGMAEEEEDDEDFEDEDEEVEDELLDDLMPREGQEDGEEEIVYTVVDGVMETPTVSYHYPERARLMPDEVGKFLRLPLDHLKKVLPEGLAGVTAKDQTLLDPEEPVDLLIRDITMKVKSSLEEANESNFLKSKSLPYILLDGKKGVGKSGVLNQIVWWARNNGWLVVYIPDGERWTTDLYGFSGIDESLREPGMWDQNEHAQWLASQLLSVHGEQLAQIPLRTEFEIPKFERTENMTLKELLEYGRDNNTPACDVIYHFRNELSLVTEFPVLIAIDGVNSLYNKSIFGNPHTYRAVRAEPLEASKLTLTRTFMNYQQHGLVRGTVLASISNETPSQNFWKQQDRKSSAIVNVPSYTPGEFVKHIQHLGHVGMIDPYMTGATSNWLFNICGGRAGELTRYVYRP